MKLTFLSLLFLAMLSCTTAKKVLPSDDDKPMKETSNSDKLTYLALGDSYTIGEGVKQEGRYPNQLVKQLNLVNSNSWEKARIIAQTGWTVQELELGIQQEKMDESTYDLVTLLIGVNNQYRGGSVENYKVEFEKMLNRAIIFAGGNTAHVAVIAIPNWGVTPFAQAKNVDKKKVKNEVKAYNLAQKTICNEKGISFIDITKEYENAGNELDMLAADGLHPSAKMYEIWEEKLLSHVKTLIY
jgi:lysophospholipase L1-like esterase